MLFMIKGTDGDSAAAPRRQHLQEHLAYIEANMAPIRVAGYLSAPDGNGMIGSLYIIDVDDEGAARTFIENDPYYDKDIWATVEIEPFTGVAGEWVGGRNW